MQRGPRADEADGLYHALNRGNSCTESVRKETDYEAFERISGEGVEQYSANQWDVNVRCRASRGMASGVRLRSEFSVTACAG